MTEVVFIDIDTQFDFMRPGGALYVKGASRLAFSLKLLTQIAARNKIFIVSSLDSHTKKDPEFKNFPPHCVLGTPGERKIPETLLKRRALLPWRVLAREELFIKIKGYQQVILEKNTYDVFGNFNLLRILKPFRYAFVYGVALDYCVKYAILGLLQVGLDVSLVTDATCAIDRKYGRKLLDYFKECGVKLLRTKDVTSELRRIQRG